MRLNKASHIRVEHEKTQEENLLYNECWRESNGEDLGAGYTSPDYLR